MSNGTINHLFYVARVCYHPLTVSPTGQCCDTFDKFDIYGFYIF